MELSYYPQFGNQLGPYWMLFSEKTETSAAIHPCFFFFFPSIFYSSGEVSFILKKIKQQRGDVKTMRKSADVGFNHDLSVMIQQPDIRCSSLDMEPILQPVFIITLNLTGKSTYNLIMLRSGYFQYSASTST